jgi:hypothetical protein
MKLPQVYSPVVCELKTLPGAGSYDLIDPGGPEFLSRKSLTSLSSDNAVMVEGSDGRVVCAEQTDRQIQGDKRNQKMSEHVLLRIDRIYRAFDEKKYNLFTEIIL